MELWKALIFGAFKFMVSLAADLDRKMLRIYSYLIITVQGWVITRHTSCRIKSKFLVSNFDLTIGEKVIRLGWGLRLLFLAWVKWVMITFIATQVHSLFGPLKYGKFCKATIHCYHVCDIDRNV